VTFATARNQRIDEPTRFEVTQVNQNYLRDSGIQREPLLGEILFQRSASGIATITLNRPRRKNAVTSKRSWAKGDE
jgi:hypothetical protein